MAAFQKISIQISANRKLRPMLQDHSAWRFNSRNTEQIVAHQKLVQISGPAQALIGLHASVHERRNINGHSSRAQLSIIVQRSYEYEMNQSQTCRQRSNRALSRVTSRPTQSHWQVT